MNFFMLFTHCSSHRYTLHTAVRHTFRCSFKNVRVWVCLFYVYVFSFVVIRLYCTLVSSFVTLHFISYTYIPSHSKPYSSCMTVTVWMWAYIVFLIFFHFIVHIIRFKMYWECLDVCEWILFFFLHAVTHVLPQHTSNINKISEERRRVRWRRHTCTNTHTRTPILYRQWNSEIESHIAHHTLHSWLKHSI